MSKVKSFIKKHWAALILWSMIILYISYFSYLTILRYKTLYSSYFDLGIMHQTVYNTYQAIRHLNPSRFLELTNPFGPEQIKRMAIHNDILLALIAPFYFIYSGPETLLIIQTVVLALGAFAVFKIAVFVFNKKTYKNIAGLVFAFAYLMYTPMQRANIFEFHAVTLATTFLLFMFYFWRVQRYKFSFIFFILSILSKEQVALTTFFFGVYLLTESLSQKLKGKGQKLRSKIKSISFPLIIIFVSIFWFIVSMLLIIPYFRGSNHFALIYYSDFGDSPFRIILGAFEKPSSILKYIWNRDTFQYIFFLLGPLAFLSFLSPFHLLIALPELGINLLSNNWNMRNIIYHYTAVIQPFVFISAIYGAHRLLDAEKIWTKVKLISKHKSLILMSILVLSVALFSYFIGPLPYSKAGDIYPFLYPQKGMTDASFWQNLLKNKRLKISTTGHMAPLFSARRYFYTFSKNYYLADYVIVSIDEVYNYPEKEMLIPAYEGMVKNPRFKLIYKSENIEVYKKI